MSIEDDLKVVDERKKEPLYKVNQALGLIEERYCEGTCKAWMFQDNCHKCKVAKAKESLIAARDAVAEALGIPE